MIDLMAILGLGPVKKGVVRLIPLSNYDKRLKHGQLVITSDGIGSIDEPFGKKDGYGRLVLSGKVGIKVQVRNLKQKARVYRPASVKVVNIINSKTGDHYPATESNYSRLLVDDLPVEFTISRRGKAILTKRSEKELEVFLPFAKQKNGINILNDLIEKGTWNPLKR
jgi:hypothetical protein